MAKLDTIIDVLGHYKYLITIVLGVAFVGVLSENSVVNLMKMDNTKRELQAEIDRYVKQNQEAEEELRALKNNPNAVEKVARERYFMKREGEDVFVLSTDIPTIEENGKKK